MKNQAAKSTLRASENLPTSPKMGRTISNLNSPRNKNPQTKDSGFPKSPPSTNTKVTHFKGERGNLVNESDTSTQDPVAKSASTLDNPAKK